MAVVLPPHIHTYHCICTSLLLASTHKLSTLPRRQPPSLDNSYILPVPSSPPTYISPPSPSPSPSRSQSPSADAEDDNGAESDQDTVMADRKEDDDPCMPEEGYTLLLGMVQDKKVLIVRGEDGFEKRLLWRCARCRLVVGYGITGADLALRELGKEVPGGFHGNVVYFLPNGVMDTDTMLDKGKMVREEDVDIPGAGSGIFE